MKEETFKVRVSPALLKFGFNQDQVQRGIAYIDYSPQELNEEFEAVQALKIDNPK